MGLNVGQVGASGVGTLAGLRADAGGRAGADFAAMLERAGRVEDAGRRAGASGASAEARAAAQELVASTLVQPILAQLRETNNAEAPFGPGQWEKTFGPMMDAEIATRIVRASNWGLIDRMTEGFTRPKASIATPDAREAGDVHA